jgi:hypothetical protein
MPVNFIACDREQELLLPPSLRDWLPERHLAWFVIDAVAELDLSAFYAPIATTVTGVRRTIRRLWWRCSCTATRRASVRRGGSSAAASRTWRPA